MEIFVLLIAAENRTKWTLSLSDTRLTQAVFLFPKCKLLNIFRQIHRAAAPLSNTFPPYTQQWLGTETR